MLIKPQETAKKLFGDIDNQSLEQIIFNAIAFFSAVISLIITIKELIFDASTNIIAVDIILTAIFVALYYLANKTRKIEPLVWLFLLATNALVVFEWFFYAGITGVAWVVFIAVSATTQTVFTGRHLLVANIFNTASFISIYIFSKIYHDIIPGVMNSHTNLDYMFFDVAMITAGITLLIYFVMREYRNKHDKVVKLNDDLMKAGMRLEEKNLELSHAMLEIKDLRNIIPICASCKNIRNDQGFYETVERYIKRHRDVNFSHTICPDCLKKESPEIYKKIFPDDDTKH